MRLRGRPALAVAAIALLGAAACKKETTVVLPPLEAVIGSGDGQFGVVGTLLPLPLRVVVRNSVTGLPRRGVTVLWDVISGDATLEGSATAVSDSTGSSDIRVRLAAAPGESAIRARLADQPEVSVEFRVHGVNRPTLTTVVPAATTAGDTVRITGANFSPVADQNVVLFTGIRGRVVSATATTLDVVVPTCLPARDFDVSVQLGEVPSVGTLNFDVTGGGIDTSLAVGHFIDVADDAGFACHTLPGGAGVSYLTLVYSASTVGAARHSFRLEALPAMAPGGPAIVQAAPAASVLDGEPTHPQAVWDQHVRELEGVLIRERALGARGDRSAPALSAPAGAPVLGERRTFNVLNGQGGFDRVGAIARSVSPSGHAAIFVDTLAPAGGFTNGELDQFAARFDQVIHPQVTAAFGTESDLDQNGRIVILFTPAVNRLTPENSSGFIGGFFYGVDLLPSNNGSNNGEVFYALVPDPLGIHGDDRTKAEVASVVPSVLAHEFQHMVHFNERILVRNGTSQEALWLSEALAQMAEEIVARQYEVLGDSASQVLFRGGARARARQYLQRPDTVSVIVTTGQGSLPERGAGFLQVVYIEDQLEGDILRRLTRTTRTGISNVEAEVGIAWPTLIANWWSALWLDQAGPTAGALTYPDFDVRGFTSPFPLMPVQINSTGLRASGSLWSSSVGYYIVTPGAGMKMTLRLGGRAGGPSPSQAVLRMRIVRVS